MSDKLSYIKTISRNDCVACGCHRGSHVPWWPDDEIHLFMGIPLCWRCAARIYYQFESYHLMQGCDLSISEYTDHMRYERDCAIKSMPGMEADFKEICEKKSGLRIINLENNDWGKSLAQAMKKDADQYEGIIFESKLVIDKDFYKSGTPVFVEWEPGELTEDLLTMSAYALIDEVKDDFLYVLFVGEQFSRGGTKITIQQLLSEKVKITKCDLKKRTDK